MTTKTRKTFSAGFTLLIAFILGAPAATYVARREIAIESISLPTFGIQLNLAGLSAGSKGDKSHDSSSPAGATSTPADSEATLRRVFPRFDSYTVSDRALLLEIEGEFPDPEGRFNLDAHSLDFYRFLETTAIDSYLRFGHRDPTWDKDALIALRLNARTRSVPTSIRGLPDNKKIESAFQQALGLGCRDPWLRHRAEKLQGQDVIRIGYSQEKSKTKRYDSIVESLETHPWPEYFSAQIHLAHASMSLDQYNHDFRAGSWSHSREATERAREKAFKDLREHLGKSVASLLRADMDLERPGVRDEFFGHFSSVMNMTANTMQDREKGYLVIERAFERTDADPHLLEIIKGDFYVDWGRDALDRKKGRDAQGRAYLDLASERFELAREALEGAWELDRQNPRICVEMIKLAKYTGDAALVETWFQRGVQIEPRNEDIYQEKFNSLLPEWGGDLDTLLAFGRQCLEDGAWAEQIPFHFVSALWTIANYGGAELGIDQEAAWRGELWLYEKYFEACPHDRVRRSIFAQRAYKTGHFIESRDMIIELGENMFAWTQFDKGLGEKWEDLRAKVFAEATKEEIDRKKNPPKPKAESLEEIVPALPTA